MPDEIVNYAKCVMNTLDLSKVPAFSEIRRILCCSSMCRRLEVQALPRCIMPHLFRHVVFQLLAELNSIALIHGIHLCRTLYGML